MKQLDPWILRQLRGLLLSDLKEFINPSDFAIDSGQLIFDQSISGAKLLSFEFKWGKLAAEAGKNLHFYSTSLMTARQVAASEVLMHLGLLTATEAYNSALTASQNMPEGEAKNTVESAKALLQLQNETLPALQINLLDGLRQYFLYLSSDESKPFQSLVQHTPVAPVHIFF